MSATTPYRPSFVRWNSGLRPTHSHSSVAFCSLLGLVIPCLLPKANAASAVEREKRPCRLPWHTWILNNNPRRNKDSGGGSPNHTSSKTM
ncbi:hypothetical protein CPAR01_14319 [Colletotrichum paranaense]|uniref:Secreted protein n=1 Tax=Colletotrichum paranaense TaxID=1914294 RepID=A0ABQ9S1V0_9PEZI|nr:uncharacterized protein CPAR01_14319 [Colletotrichum paranaense]KAK1522776.1 hypothetical protein CPAR01_14319 [Colletotrichum paranaense]